ncbi:MAG TPA: ABC transporter permease subunit [Casimicrobiaceae bacterium]|nr:ABC transporter permease subunit [Casimicrobiaceae bacterium]
MRPRLAVLRSPALFRDRLPRYAIQAALLAAVALVAWRAVVNFIANAHALGVAHGFGFLDAQAGFQIAQSLIAFGPASSYLDAVVVAVLNTLLVVVLSSVLSTLVALVVAFGRLAPTGLIRGASSLYVELFRNIPLLLQILFWYALAIALLPGVADSIAFAGIVLNNRGLFLPSLGFTWTAGFDVSWPHVEGFAVSGGIAVLPELIALTLGLSIYNSAFLAEIFRAGILAVPRGQVEAATTVGLNGLRAALLIVLPQALRVALPAAGGQYQTLAKASSLAAAIGYPDIMQIIGGTIASQTSQALEAMALVIVLYAAINLAIAMVVGVLNARLLRRGGT